MAATAQCTTESTVTLLKDNFMLHYVVRPVTLAFDHHALGGVQIATEKWQ